MKVKDAKNLEEHEKIQEVVLCYVVIFRVRVAMINVIGKDWNIGETIQPELGFQIL